VLFLKLILGGFRYFVSLYCIYKPLQAWRLSEIILTIEGIDPLDLFGMQDAKVNLLKEAFPGVQINTRGNTIKILGEKKQAQEVKDKFELMVKTLKEFKELTLQQVEDIVGGYNPFSNKLPHKSSGNNTIVHAKNGKPIKAKTANQKILVESSEKNDIVFAVGPAGTGKTYTAVALAVRALKNKVVQKIILTRPAVEAGESLGFLPGDLKEKVDPYLRPLYDALDDMIPADKLAYLISSRIIEVAPLAFMRGRTLDNAFIILDEAQNTTNMQMKMFLTRLGPNAKCIVTGDMTQIDLPYNQKSGLKFALSVLGSLEGIGSVYLTAEDVVRHRLVKEIIKAYAREDEKIRKQYEDYSSKSKTLKEEE
jgi:phosphate starvation-inducible protein PhoH and related proteins